MKVFSFDHPGIHILQSDGRVYLFLDQAKSFFVSKNCDESEIDLIDTILLTMKKHNKFFSPGDEYKFSEPWNQTGIILSDPIFVKMERLQQFYVGFVALEHSKNRVILILEPPFLADIEIINHA